MFKAGDRVVLIEDHEVRSGVWLKKGEIFTVKGILISAPSEDGGLLAVEDFEGRQHGIFGRRFRLEEPVDSKPFYGVVDNSSVIGLVHMQRFVSKKDAIEYMNKAMNRDPSKSLYLVEPVEYHTATLTIETKKV